MNTGNIHYDVVKPGEMTIHYNARLLPFIAAAFCLVRMRVIKMFFVCQKAVNNFKIEKLHSKTGKTFE